MTGFPWIMEVFGIPLIATSKFYKSGKLNHVASILAELLDNDSDGCVDDPNVLRNILTKWDGMRRTIILPDDVSVSIPDASITAMETKGFVIMQNEGEAETIPKCSGLKGSGECVDATIEELLHFVQSQGHSLAYPRVFGTGWNANSNLTRAMDIAR